MNNKTIGIVVAIVILAILAYFFVFNKKTNAPSDTSVQGTEQSAGSATQAENSSASPQSLMELVKAGSSVKCTFSEAGSTGTMYVSGGKARGDFTSNDQKGHMIVADNTSYIWMDGASQGFKAMANSSASAESNPAAQGSVDASKKMNYSCAPWSADASMFALPSSVQFMDIEGMMKVNQ